MENPEQQGGPASRRPRWSIVWCKTLTLVAIAVASASTGLMGLPLVAYSTLARLVSPAAVSFHQDVQFQYNKTEATGRVWFVTEGQQLQAGVYQEPPASRFLQPGQAIDFWLTLSLPRSAHNRQLFQVTASLETATGTTIGEVSRPCLLRSPKSWGSMIRAAARAPAVLLQLVEGEQEHVVRLKLFENFVERPDRPLAGAQLVLRAFMAPGAPEVYWGAVDLHLRMGWLSWMLYWIRPSTVTSVALLLAGVLMSMAGFSAALVAALLALWAIGSAVRQDLHPAVPDAAVAAAVLSEAGGSPVLGQKRGREEAGSSHLDTGESAGNGLATGASLGAAAGLRKRPARWSASEADAGSPKSWQSDAGSSVSAADQAL